MARPPRPSHRPTLVLVAKTRSAENEGGIDRAFFRNLLDVLSPALTSIPTPWLCGGGWWGCSSYAICRLLWLVPVKGRPFPRVFITNRTCCMLFNLSGDQRPAGKGRTITTVKH